MSFARIKAVYRDSGIGGVLLFAVKKLLRPVMDFGTLVFFECDLRKAFPAPPKNNGFISREAFMQDLDLLNAMEDSSRFRKKAIDRLKDGERWFVGLDASTGALANYRWLNDRVGFIPEIGRYLIVNPGEVYIYDLFTLPQYRRLGVDAFTRYSVYRSLADAGVARIHAYVRGSNRPSLRAARLLLSETGRLWYVTILGRSFILSTRGRSLPSFRRMVLNAAEIAVLCVITALPELL